MSLRGRRGSGARDAPRPVTRPSVGVRARRRAPRPRVTGRPCSWRSSRRAARPTSCSPAGQSRCAPIAARSPCPAGAARRTSRRSTTALREAREEVGLAPRDRAPARLAESRSSTFASGSSIWPVVGVLARRPELVDQPDEVERVFTVALADLVADGAFLEERWRRDAGRRDCDDDGFFPIYFFKVPGDVIWGATARVLDRAALRSSPARRVARSRR